MGKTSIRGGERLWVQKDTKSNIASPGSLLYSIWHQWGLTVKDPTGTTLKHNQDLLRVWLGHLQAQLYDHNYPGKWTTQAPNLNVYLCSFRRPSKISAYPSDCNIAIHRLFMSDLPIMGPKLACWRLCATVNTA